MSARTLHFVVRSADADPPDPAVDVVVLDTAWTPTPADRPDLSPIRPHLHDVLDRVDLFDGSLEALDAWAEASGLADRLVADDVTWWYRVRMVVRWDLHERMLWRFVLDGLMPAGRYDRVIVPLERRALLDAARATRPGGDAIEVIAREAIPPEPAPTEDPALARRSLLQVAAGLPRRVARRSRRLVREVIRRLRRQPRPVPPRVLAARRRAETLAGRVDRLTERVTSLAARPGGILAIASANFFQVLGSQEQARFVDPHLALVLDRLEAEGTPVATVVLAIDHRRDADWERIEADPAMIPDSFVRARWETPEDTTIDADEVARRLAEVAEVPMDVAGWDLGPAMHALVADHAASLIPNQRRWSRLAERLLREIGPSAILVDHEGVRTLWIAAAKRLGIPVVAVQHGVIYPNNPEFCHALHPGLVRPDMTCVYGRYERDVLVDGGGYQPDRVVVTGSSRADPDAQIRAGSPTERDDVRRSLGVRDGDRMVVVSVAHNPVMGDVHSVCMVARTLGGPLPGVHVIFKLHPQERTDAPYERVVRGLALAGGYEPPAMTSVRDVDLYRLLRSADAHLGQYSTVNTDAVVAGTPTLLAVGQAYSDMLGYVAAGVATPVRDVDDVRRALDAVPVLDPVARSGFLADHYDRGDATGRIVDVLRRIAASDRATD